MNKTWSSLLVLGALALAPFAGAYPVFVMKVLCFALFASAFNLLVGYVGLLSFGHAALFGGAGYIAGHALKAWGLPPEVGLALGTCAGAGIGFVMGLLAIRREGIYFAMISLAVAQMLYFVFLQAPFTGGEDGLQGVPRGKLFGVLSLDNDLTLYYTVLLVVAAAFALIVRAVHSPFGEVLRAIRDNEPRAVSLGYHTDRYKLLAFVLSAAISGLAGSLKVLVLGFETLTDVHWSMSGTVILMTLVGGLGSHWGPPIGALVIVLIESKLGDLGAWLADLTGIDWLRTIGDSSTLVTGVLFIIVVLFMRNGISGAMADVLGHLKRRRWRVGRTHSQPSTESA